MNFRKQANGGGKKEVPTTSFGDHQESAEFVPLKKSVKAQVHSLEARGRQLISARQEEAADGTKTRPGFHKQMPPRSRH